MSMISRLNGGCPSTLRLGLALSVGVVMFASCGQAEQGPPVSAKSPAPLSSGSPDHNANVVAEKTAANPRAESVPKTEFNPPPHSAQRKEAVPPPQSDDIQQFLKDQIAVGRSSLSEMMASPEYKQLSPEAKERFRQWLAPAQASIDKVTERIVSGEIPRLMDKGIEAIRADEAKKVSEKAAAALSAAIEARDSVLPVEKLDPILRNLVSAYGQLAPATQNLADARARVGLSESSVDDSPFMTAASLKAELEYVARDNRGVRALFFAARDGYYFSAKALIDAGVDIRAVDAGGRTALQIAKQHRYVRIVELLQEASSQRPRRRE